MNYSETELRIQTWLSNILFPSKLSSALPVFVLRSLFLCSFPSKCETTARHTQKALFVPQLMKGVPWRLNGKLEAESPSGTQFQNHRRMCAAFHFLKKDKSHFSVGVCEYVCVCEWCAL